MEFFGVWQQAPEALPVLRRIAADRSEPTRIRGGAVAALGRYGDRESLPLLLQLLTSESDLRPVAAIALGRVNDPRARERLVREVESTSGEAHRVAALSLGGQMAPEVCPLFQRIAGRPEWSEEASQRGLAGAMILTLQRECINAALVIGELLTPAGQTVFSSVIQNELRDGRRRYPEHGAAIDTIVDELTRRFPPAAR